MPKPHVIDLDRSITDLAFLQLYRLLYEKKFDVAYKDINYMNSLVNRRIMLVLCVAIFWIQVGTANAAAPQNSLPAPNASDGQYAGEKTVPAEPLRPVNTEGIDEAGKKVGEGLDRISDLSAGYLGDWVKQKILAGIPLIKLLFCFLLLMVVMVIERLLRWGIQRKIGAIPYLEGVISWWRLFLKAVFKPLSLFIYVYGIYAALSPLYGHFERANGTNLVLTVVKHCADIGGTVALFWFFYQLVILLDARLMKWAESTDSSIDNMLVPLIGKSLRVFIVIVGGMMVLQNLTGLQIGPLLASLGIGGLAVALAAKETIANFFGTLTILFDKPFQVGDRIIINSYDGSVENVGRRPNIRWLTQIGITYDTPAEKVREAVRILQDILKDHEGMHPDLPPRVHFNGFNDWNLNITVVLWYHPPEWWDYQAWLQKTCLEILQQFDAAGIDFAFPSQTLYLANEDKRQLKLQLIKGDTFDAKD